MLVETTYTVVDLYPEPDLALPAYRLLSDDGPSYDVAVTEHGMTCDCADMIWRREKRGYVCKHCHACVLVHLFPEGVVACVKQ